MPNVDTAAVVDNGPTTALINASGATANTLLVDGGSAVQLKGGDLGSASGPLSSITVGTHGTIEFSGGTAFNHRFIDNGIVLFDAPFAQNTGVISGTGQVIIKGSFLTTTGNNSYTGGTTIDSGSLTIIDGGSITGPVIDNSLFSFNRSDTFTFAGAITGTGNVTQIGSGTTILTGNNTYTGGTTISTGTLQAGSTTALSLNSAFTVNATLNLNGFNNTIGSLSGTGTVLNNNDRGAAATLTVGQDTTSTIFGGTLQDGNNVVALAKIGTGTLTLTGTNTYSGGTTINVGTLRLGNGGPSGSITGNVIDNGVLSFDRNNTLTFVGAISGTGSVTQIGTGTTILTGINTYTGGTMISAGTLQAGSATAFSPNSEFTVNSILDLHGFNSTIGSLSGTGIVLNNGAAAAVLNVGSDNSDSTFNGNLQNGTSVLLLTKSGTGRLTLTGNNTYIGATIISAGTLQAGSTTGFSPNSEFTVNSILDLHGFNSTIGSLSGTGTVLNNGATAAVLTVGSDNTDSTFSGVVQNGTSPLHLTKSGAGTLTLTGNNTYAGGTNISAGTLQLGSGGTTGSISGNVANNGTLAFDRSDALTFGGAITATGNVSQIGAGKTILTGKNTYTGGTTVSAGTLQVGNGGTTGSISENVVDNGTLAFDRSDALTFGGTITGTGNVVQLGTGTLTFPSTSKTTYTGLTIVNSGSLIVDGSIGSVVVNPGGFLGGHGTIGSLVNSGIVGQINSPGTLTVTSNYTQNSDGTLRIGVAGLASDQHDLLAVNGHASVAGTLQLIQLGNFTLQPGNQFTFLTAKNGVSGKFNTTQNGLVSTGTIVQAEVTTLPNAVVLEAVQGSFANTPGVATTPNESAVAKALDSAVGDPRAAALFAFLNSQPLANLPHDLALIAPTQVSSINATAVSVGKVQVSNLGQRLVSIRGGSTGFSSSGFAINGGAASFGAGFAGVSGPEGKSGTSVLAPTPENRWGVFLTGLGEFTNVDSTPNAAGYDVDTGGFTLGVDYRLTPNFVIGLTGGYAHNSVNIDGGGGNIGVNAGQIGLYATVFANGFYLDTAVSGGPSSYNTKRTALQGTARGNTDGGDVNVLVAAGYDWKSGNLTIGPTASFQYSYVGLNGFTETGSLAPLTFPDQNTESERTAFGAKASYDWKIGQITAIPQISAAWQHEYGATAYSVVAGFANGAGNSFTVVGPPIGRDSLLIGAGATVILNDRVSTYLYYDGEVARTNYESHSVTGGVRITF